MVSLSLAKGHITTFIKIGIHISPYIYIYIYIYTYTYIHTYTHTHTQTYRTPSGHGYRLDRDDGDGGKREFGMVGYRMLESLVLEIRSS